MTPDEAPAVIGTDLRLAMYRTMLLIRRFQERILGLRAERRVIGPVHPYTGQEAIAVGVCNAMRDDDRVISTYRGQGHAIAKGACITELTAELFGKNSGMNGGWAANHFSDPDCGLVLASGIVGGGVPVSAGVAMAMQLDGHGQVAVCFLGDGAMGAGVVHETLNIASVHRLPLVLVCENNAYQGATRSEMVYPSVELARLAKAHELTVETVDGNDLDEVVRAARAAVARGRAGAATFLEMKTYLTTFHIHFDEPSREARPAAELAAWVARDPLAAAEAALRADGVTTGTLMALEDAVAEEITVAVANADGAAWPASDGLPAVGPKSAQT